MAQKYRPDLINETCGTFWNVLTKLILVTTVCCCSSFAQILNPLDKHIVHHETLDYDPKPNLMVLHRSRRSAAAATATTPFQDQHTSTHHFHHSKSNPTYRIDFDSHGRNFQLRLKPDIESVFHNDLVIEDGDGKPITVNLDHLVTGYLHNQPNSLVHGSIKDGIFEGRIHSTIPEEHIFFVERAHKYYPTDPIDIYLLDNRTQKTNYNLYDLVKGVTFSKTSTLAPNSLRSTLPFHSVIYSSKHVRDPFRHRRSPIDGACGANEKVREWMDSVAMSATSNNDDDDGDDGDIKNTYSDFDHHNSTIVNVRNNSTNPNSPSPLLHRSKRASNYDLHYNRRFEAQGRISYNRPPPPPQQTSTPYLPSKRACSLYIQTDTFLWDHVKKLETDKSDIKVREEIASLVAQHIKAVNHIYETSVFKNIMGLKFIVQRLRINDSSACEGKKREFNQFCSPNIDVSNFLNLNSQFNHNDFCLAYIFTYRDFSGGTLGLAWVASTSGASGGICEKYKTFTENINGKQVQTKRSLNTGIITFVNYNSRVPPKVSELTLAHEIGHNFGSPHDYPAECRPGGPLGNYIMYSSATSGERQNNNKFSHCSITNISTVLNAVFNNEGKENCFQEDNGPFCGNKIVEEGEECDCGYDSRECNEDCCYPRNVDEFKQLDPDAQPCRRRPGAFCSPSQGPCCTERCLFEGKNKQCRDDGECTYKSFCSGQRAHCPLPPAKPNKTECNMGTQVCWRGSCTGSICQKYDLEECFLTAKRGAKPDEMCEVACQQINQSETCRRTSEINIMKNISGMKLRPGSPCNDFQGYCDVFQRCRPVDAEGPLARLKNLLFNKKTLISIKQWVTTYWWACTLMLFAGFLFMAAFIKCCAVHTPSSNPERKKALRISDTLRRPADTLRRKSRERTQASNSRSSNGNNSGHHRESRERSNNHGRGHQRISAPGANSNATQSQHQASSSSSNQSQSNSHNAMVAHSVVSPINSANVVAPATAATSASSSSAFPPRLVVNLPPPKDLPREPPPPYPGLTRPSAPPLTMAAAGGQGTPPSLPGGPSHGYGEGRGHYNRQNHSSNGPSSNTSNSGSGSAGGKSSKSGGKKDSGESSKNHHRR